MKRQRRTTRKSKKTKRTRRVQRGGSFFDGFKSLFTGLTTSATTTAPPESKAVELTTLSGTSSPTLPSLNKRRNSNVTLNNNPVPLTFTVPEGVVRPLPSAPPASGEVETPSSNIYRPLPSAPSSNSTAGGSRKKKSKRSKRSMRKKSRKGC